MCLLSRSFLPKRAKKDIICYKILRQSQGSLYSPVMDTLVILSCLEAKGLNFPKRRKEYWQIGKGYIHAFLSKNLAYITCSTTFDDSVHRVYKCMIPKGTKYYTGINSEICAKKLIIL